MRYILAALTVGALLIPFTASAQDLEERVAAIENLIDLMINNHNAMLEKVREVATKSTEVEQRLAAIERQVEVLAGSTEKILTSVENMNEQHGRRLEALDERVGQIGTYVGVTNIPDLASGSPKLNRDIYGVTNGKLEVHNNIENPGYL